MDSQAAAEVAFLRSWGLDSSSVVVDLGCGTGQFALSVAPECRSVVAVDVSSVMRKRLYDKLQEAGLDNVEIAAAGRLITPVGSLPSTKCRRHENRVDDRVPDPTE